MKKSRRAGASTCFYKAFVSGGSHTLLLCYIAMLFMPVYALSITTVRAAQFHQHVTVSPLNWLEAVGLALLALMTIILSALAGAGLKTWMKRWTSLWPGVIIQVWIMLQFLLATLELRYFAQNADKLPGSASVPPIAAMTVWVFLVGYLAKIPWDRVVELIGKRIEAASTPANPTS